MSNPSSAVKVDENGKKRSNIACIRCRKRHIKCDGEGPPCSKCQQSNSLCEYIEGEKKIVISMKYLTRLHDEISKLKIENANLRNAMKTGVSELENNNDLNLESISKSNSVASTDHKSLISNDSQTSLHGSISMSTASSSAMPPSSLGNSSMDTPEKSIKSSSSIIGLPTEGSKTKEEDGSELIQPHDGKKSTDNEVIPPFLDKYGRTIQSRTGERIYIGSSSMTLFGLEINRLVAPMMLNNGGNATASPESSASSGGGTTNNQTAETETILEREGNAYRIMLGKTHSRPGINVNFTLPSYSYAMLLVDSFISYNDGCFYFFNEGLVKENLRRIYNDDTGFKPDYGNGALNSKETEAILETIWFCKVLLIFAIGEMYLGTANNLNGYKLNDKGKKKKQKLNSSHQAVTKLPGSGFFNQASELFTGLFASGAIDNCAREGGIEVLLLYAFYLQVADCTVASYFYFGIALRASLILGFHVDVGKDSLNRYELEHRRRLWWTVYMYERMLASKAGLPLSLTDDDISSELPDDFDMSDPPTGCENYIFPEAEFIRNCVKITQINANILRRLYTRQPSSNILPIVHELVVSLLRWKKSLPDYINCDYQQAEIQVSRLVVNMMTEYFQGINLAVRPLLFHFVLSNLKTSNPKSGTYLDLSKYSSDILTLLNASFQASVNTIRSLWALMPENMVALFGYMDREYLFTSTATLVLFNSTFGVHDATLEYLDQSLTMFTKMRNLGNHPATLRREQILKLLSILDFNGAMVGLIHKHGDNIIAPVPDLNHQSDSSGFQFQGSRRQAEQQQQQEELHLFEQTQKQQVQQDQEQGDFQQQQLNQIHQMQSSPSYQQHQSGQSPYPSLSQQDLSKYRLTQAQRNQYKFNQIDNQQSQLSPLSALQNFARQQQQQEQMQGLFQQPASLFGAHLAQNSAQQQHQSSSQTDDSRPLHPVHSISRFSPLQVPASGSQIFSPSLLPSLAHIEDVPNFENLETNNTNDMELWKDITSQGAWLAGADVGEEFSQLVHSAGITTSSSGNSIPSRKGGDGGNKPAPSK